jgi:putative transposase
MLIVAALSTAAAYITLTCSPGFARSGILIRRRKGEEMAQKRKLTDEQIVAVVKQLEAGRTAAEMAREIGVSTYTIYSWKAKFGGLEPNEATKLRHLDDENSRLKKLVAELALDKEMLKALLIKNGLSS